MWSHRSPYFDTRDNPNAAQGEELCDLLAVFENDVFLFEDKNIAWPQHDDPTVSWKRWYRRAIYKPAGQLAKAERRLRRHPSRVFADRACKSPLPVQLPEVRLARYHRIVVAHGAAGACRRHFGGGSGALMLNTHRGAAGLPFTVGRVGPKDGYVHVLDEATLELVLSTLDTIPEFRDYLLAKERLLEEGKDFSAPGEEDLLAIYLRSPDSVQPNRNGFGNTGGVNLIVVPEGEWDEFSRSPEKAAKDQANEHSYAWDELIDRFAKHSMGRTQYFSTSSGPQQTERTLRLLNAEPRTVRRALIAQCLERIGSMGDRPYRVWTARRPESTGTCYTFLAVRRGEGEEYAEYRERRLYMLTMCTAIVRLQQPGAQAYVGIGQGPIDGGDNSEDVLLIDESAWTVELEAAARRFQEEFGVLRDIHEARFTAHEYPLPPPTELPRGPQRKCPECGSARVEKPGARQGVGASPNVATDRVQVHCLDCDHRWHVTEPE